MLISDLHNQYSETTNRRQTRLRAVLAAVLCVFWLMLLMFNSLLMKNMVVDSTVAQLEETTDLVVNRFQGRQDSVLTQLSILAKNFEAVDRSTGYTLEPKEILDEIGEYNPFDCFGYVDETGMEIDAAGYSYDDRAYPFYSLGMSGQSGCVPVKYSELEGYYQVYYVPIKDGKGQVKGVLTGFYDKNFLLDVIGLEFDGEAGLSFLTDENGVILATNVDTEIETLSEFFAQNSYDTEAYERAYESGEGIFQYHGINGISYAAIKRVGTQNIYVVEGYPSLTYKNILASYQGRSSRLLSITAGITILVFMFYLGVLRKRHKKRDEEYKTIYNVLSGVNRMYEATVLIDLEKNYGQVLSKSEHIHDPMIERDYGEIRKRIIQNARLETGETAEEAGLLSVDSLSRALDRVDSVIYELNINGYWINLHLCCVERIEGKPRTVLLMISDINDLKRKEDFLLRLPVLIHGRSFENLGIIYSKTGIAQMFDDDMEVKQSQSYEKFLESYKERGLWSEQSRFDRELQLPSILSALKDKKAADVQLSIRNNENVYETFRISYRMYSEADGEIVVVSDRVPESVDVDPLTSALTMHGMVNAVETFLYAHGGAYPLMLVHFNVRSFSAVNSLHSRKKGDEILCSIKQLLEESTLHPIAIARSEADSFLLLIKQEDFDRREIDRLLKMTVEDQNLNLYCAVLRFTNIKEQSLQQYADKIALVSESLRKNANNSFMEYTQDFFEEYFNELNVLKNVNKALADNEFQIYFQPIVDAKTREIVSAEALVRWILPDGKVVPPSMFIPTLEKNNEIGKLDLHIVNLVRDKIHRLQEEGAPHVPCAVNLSRLDVINESVMSEVLRLIEASEIDHSLLRFEVTESVAAQLGERENYYLNKIRALGCPLLMDDFGAGASSLAGMCAQSFDILKMDMLFARQIEQSEVARQTIITMINYAHALGLKVIAEGVENRAQYEFLRDHDCDYIQGYYFAKPLAQVEFEVFLSKGCLMDRA